MSLDIKKYEVLLSTLDKGCFAKACEDLGYTQPAITHMMKSMEREIGFPLLKRSNKGIQLTSEGREVLPLIRELVAANDRLNKHYDMLRGVETGSVRVGTFPTVGGAWLPRIIAQFEKKYPQIQIDVLEENSIHKIEEWLTGGRIDVALFARQPYHTFDWIPLKMDPYYGILPLEHELTSYDRLTAADFENQPFLMCCSMEGPDLDITRFFQQHGVTIRSRWTLPSRGWWRPGWAWRFCRSCCSRRSSRGRVMWRRAPSTHRSTATLVWRCARASAFPPRSTGSSSA